MDSFKEKTDEELNKLNDKNLLAYYKAERKRYHHFHGTKVCDCCGEVIGDREFIKQAELEIKIRTNYLDKIKSLLSQRGHVEKTQTKPQRKLQKH